MRKILWAGQISSLFGASILSLRHFFLLPRKDFPLVFAILLIGFLPSLFYFYFISKLTSYVIVTNALAIVAICYYLLGEFALGGFFLLVPVLSLLFKNKRIYFFSSISSIIFYLLLTNKNSVSQEGLVIILDHMTLFIVMVFLIYLVVQELMETTTNEAKQLQTIMSLSRSVEARDAYTKGHSERVARLGRAISSYIPELQDELVYKTGIIHDVGKLTTPDYILSKKGKLTEQEFSIMKRHTIEGTNICRSLGISEEFIDGVLYHHERWDGNGYPYGLKENDIPLLARVLSMADAIDAMSSTRAYRGDYGIK